MVEVIDRTVLVSEEYQLFVPDSMLGLWGFVGIG